MKKTASVALLLLLHAPYFAMSAGIAPTATVVPMSGMVTLTTPFGQHQKISVSHAISEHDISFEDLNFDGYLDLKILNAEGNVQKFYDVHLFNPKTKQYEMARDFSNIPCVMADSKIRQLVGQCFHASACENWIERYVVDRRNQLHLVSREGTYCDPSSGASFSYVDRFENGRRISSRSTPLHRGD